MKHPVLALVALAVMSSAAYAQHTTTLTGSIFDGPFKNGPQTFDNPGAPSGSGETPAVPYVPYVEPVVVVEVPVEVIEEPVIVAPVEEPVIEEPVLPVDPVEPPTEVPATPLEPAIPGNGILTGNIADTPFAGTPAGFYRNVEFNGQTYDALVLPNGNYIARPVHAN